MGNSLKIGAGSIELLNWTPGTSRYALARGLDSGQIAPDTTTLSSLLLDGEFISGKRTTNKTWAISVLVFAPDRKTLSQYVDTLLSAVTSDTVVTFPVVWTPNGGAPTVFTAYRAAATPHKELVKNDQLIMQVDLTFQTGPFGASQGPQIVTVPAAGGAGVTPTVVDGINTTGSYVNGTRDTTYKYEGASSMNMATTFQGYLFGISVFTTQACGRTFSTAQDFSGYASMSVRASIEVLTGGSLTNTTLTLTLVSASGYATLTVTVDSPAGLLGAWKQVAFSIADMSVTGSFDITHVTEWLFAANIQATLGSGLPHGFNVDTLTGNPPGGIGNATAHGNLLTVPGVLGSARATCQIAATLNASAAFTNLVAHFPPGDQDPDATILAAFSAGSVTIPAANFTHNDTFSPALLLTASAGVGVSRVITLTVTQKLGANTVATKVLTATVTGTQTIVNITSDFLTLPLVDKPAENINSSLTIAVSSANGSDTISDLLLCSTRGQTTFATGLPATTTVFYIDPPSPTVGGGPVYYSDTDRTDALSAMSYLGAYSTPQLEPGDNKVLLASTAGPPGCTAQYTPNWLEDALV